MGLGHGVAILMAATAREIAGDTVPGQEGIARAGVLMAGRPVLLPMLSSGANRHSSSKGPGQAAREGLPGRGADWGVEGPLVVHTPVGSPTAIANGRRQRPGKGLRSGWEGREL